LSTLENSPLTKEAEIAAGDDTDVLGNQGAPEIDENETASRRQQSKQLMVHTELYLLAKYLPQITDDDSPETVAGHEV
jgi:hypothetical protein